MLGKPHIFYHFHNLFNKFNNTGILLEASLDVILSNKRITKALIRLRKQRVQAGLAYAQTAGWSAPLLFANP